MSWWLWLLLTVLMIIIVLLLLFLIQWLLRRRVKEEAVPEAWPAPATAAQPAPEVVARRAPAAVEEPVPVVEVEPEAPEPDDLKVVEGIGPKIASVLQEAGIATFAQLAATEVDRLQLILDEAHVRLADPGTWPEQAKIAAAGDWEALEALQEQLKGGRRV